MKSFQQPMKAITARVTMMGFKSGNTTFTKMRHSPAPSMRAASRSSSGIDRAYSRTR